MPETADGYALNIPEALGKIITPEKLAADPMIATLREHYKAAGRTQGDFDNLFEALGLLEAKGFVPAPIDFAAERAALGENGAARQGEVETFAKSLKARGDIDDAEFGELMSLAPTAAGVRLVEKLRKMTGTGKIDPPNGQGADPGEAAKAEAQAMARDPKYGVDRQFTKEADAKFMAAFKDG